MFLNVLDLDMPIVSHVTKIKYAGGMREVQCINLSSDSNMFVLPQCCLLNPISVFYLKREVET